MSDGDPVAAGDNSAALARIEQRLIELEAAALRSAARAEQQHQTVTEWFGHAAQALEALGNHSQSTARSVSILQTADEDRSAGGAGAARFTCARLADDDRT